MTKLTAEIVVGTDITETEKIYFVRNLLNIKFSGQERSNPSLPSWGIQSNSGTLEMYDVDGELADLNQDDALFHAPIRIYLKTDKRQEQIGGFVINSISKPNQDLITKIEFSDTLTQWQNISMPQFYYPYSSAEDGRNSLYNLFKEVCQKAKIQISLPSDVELWFKSFYAPVLKLDSGSFWAQMNKICEATGCYICCDREGNPQIFVASEAF